ncbi:hypothetical protein AB0N62_08560 [Streptomyces sp. NPDC093982]|uniref:hypothetical protein n=1 Tax=Streptomyces sp. NPDC093982 TaxID=3155077 RepID=UPI00343A6706
MPTANAATIAIAVPDPAGQKPAEQDEERGRGGSRSPEVPSSRMPRQVSRAWDVGKPDGQGEGGHGPRQAGPRSSGAPFGAGLVVAELGEGQDRVVRLGVEAAAVEATTKFYAPDAA